jgi:putative peptide zinc metalloprotease protein
MVGTLTASEGSAKEPVRLPPLREDLRLLPGAVSHEGAPTWTLHDPARHRFFRIGWLQFEILSRWGLGRSDIVADSIKTETTIQAKESDVASFLQFAGFAGLFTPLGEHGTRRLSAEADRRRLSAGSWLLKNYLFLRIRLLSPDRLLSWLLTYAGFIYTRGFAVVIGCLALIGLYLVGRQWDEYWHEFQDLFSLEGALMVGIALSGAKIIHELGHGLTARYFGCRVPAMGIALLVLWPVLWTDTTDAWRLSDRRQRMAIDAAGMASEIVLAVLATLAWTVLPDGPARTAAFLLSSSTWIITILVNVNPLMRFDGYYLLSDWLDVPNLQDRGLALARWWLRETLFALGDRIPEVLPSRLRTVVLTYALSTLIYRFFLFMGIALLVFHIGFKALGLFLMAVEVWWFIARPILNELRVWGRRLGNGRPSKRALVTFGVFAAVVALLVVPWYGSVSGPAVLRAEHEATLFTDEPGRLVSMIPNDTRVAAGDVVFRLESPTLDSRQEIVRAKATALRTRIEGQAFDPEHADDIDVTWEELAQALAEGRSLDAQRAGLAVRAPFSGTVRDVSQTLRLGQWLPRREALAILVDLSDHAIEAYVAEADVSRVHLGATARFYPANTEAPLFLRVESVDAGSTRILEERQLASVWGGPLAARRDNAGKLIPAGSVYKLLLQPRDGSAQAFRRIPGIVVIEGDARSILGGVYRRAVALLMREAGL